jgi:hypothetical protein
MRGYPTGNTLPTASGFLPAPSGNTLPRRSNKLPKVSPNKKPVENVLAENYLRLREIKKRDGTWNGPGVSPKTANNVEKSRHNTKLQTIIKLAATLGVDPFHMLVPVEDEKFLDVMRAWAQTDEQGKDNIHVIAKAMLDRIEGKKDEARSGAPVVQRKRDRAG